MDEKSLTRDGILGKALDNENVKVIGNGDMFQLLYKASSKKEGWMKSCKAMEIPQMGCVVQVTTQQGSNVAEALVFVPQAEIVNDINGGKKLLYQHGE